MVKGLGPLRGLGRRPRQGIGGKAPNVPFS